MTTAASLATATTTAQQAAPLGLMSCVRESSPQDQEQDADRNEPSKKRRFHPFRGLKKMFRRKARNSGGPEDAAAEVGAPAQTEAQRSRSTSELLAEDEPRRKSGTAMFPGLSVSHDSVFTADQQSTHSSTDLDLDTAQSSSSLSIQQLIPGVRAELLDAVRRRRGRGDTSEDDEDLGLPRSPCNSPTANDHLHNFIKDNPTKSHSTCSDGSLLSMGSSEMDEESLGPHSRNSSKLSLYGQTTEYELELGLTSNCAPLSHSAARHRMAVKPKRTHGPPRRRRPQQIAASSALPATPELNEDVSTRSLTPESSITRETISELYSNNSTSMTKVWKTNNTIVSEAQLKSASLPPGLALPSGGNKLSRSRSNAGSWATKDKFTEEEELLEKSSKEDKRKEESFFGRFLARRSGKKKKSKSEDLEVTSNTVTTKQIFVKSVCEKQSNHTQLEDNVRINSVDAGKNCITVRSGAASRQRVQPIDIPSSPELQRTKHEQYVDAEMPMPPLNNSPTNSFLPEPSPPKKKPALLNYQTKTVQITSPLEKNCEPLTKPIWPEKKISTKFTELKLEAKEETKTKVKISGLSSYQQRVMSYNDEFDSIKSSTESEEICSSKNVTKSQSFRSTSIITAKQEPSSLPFIMNSFGSDDNESTDSPESSINCVENDKQVNVNCEEENIKISQENVQEIQILNNNSEMSQSKDILSKDGAMESKHNSNENISSVIITSNETFKRNTDSITISCVNTEVQSMVNTQNSNQVIVSISNVTDPVSNITNVENKALKTDNNSQVSITKVQFKRDNRLVDNITHVPEFLKIQLNKVDAKPATHVVLSTSTDNFTEEKKNFNVIVENENKMESVSNIDLKRKFSKDDVDIIDKNSMEECTVIPSKNIVITNKQVVKPVVSTNCSESKSQNHIFSSVQMRKSSLITLSPTPKISFVKKTSVDLSDINMKALSETTVFDKSMTSSSEKLTNKTEVLKEKSVSSNDIQDNQSSDVVLRKKSLSSQKHDKNLEEPELMKVFARRSLKLKDSEAESLSQQVLVLVENSDDQLTENNPANRSRDSDKENESESPHEERKKNNFSLNVFKETPKVKEPLIESKYVETSEVMLRKPITTTNNIFSAFGGSKFPRVQSLGTVTTNEVNTNDFDKRKNKSLIEQKTESKPLIMEKNYNRARFANFKDKETEVTKVADTTKCNKSNDEIITNVSLKNNFENEDFVPMFKRIQQRKEEWEQRAQQAMKKTVP